MAVIPAWKVETVSGRAGDLHAGSEARLRSGAPGRTVRVLDADRPALVLGSHQPEDHFDPRALRREGVEVARRPSGGSAVLVGPGSVLWVDFVVTGGDPLWDDDVRRSGHWVGRLWAEALSSAGVAPASTLSVWQHGMRPALWSPVICFAGLGPGEVRMGPAKVVGVAQRRIRRAALIQTAALLHWDPSGYTGLLSPAGWAAAGGDAAAADEGVLSSSAQGIGAAREEAVRAALLRGLDDMIV